MKMKLLMESFKKFLKENFQREDYDHALGEVFIALEDLDNPPYSWSPVEEIEINGKSYPIRGNFNLAKNSKTGGTFTVGGRKPFYRISGNYDYDLMSIVFTIKHQEWLPESHPHKIETGERFMITYPIQNFVVSSVDEAMGLADLIRRDYQGLKEMFGTQ